MASAACTKKHRLTTYDIERCHLEGIGYNILNQQKMACERIDFNLGMKLADDAIKTSTKIYITFFVLFHETEAT